ncbi:PIG-L deacetylase family protein [Prosthecomicrobium sp. N25]|uniref:PIG-L deacetylase family protein n=1 Tax=Prosthecomicrobium sp. N25 TaxID=3129254 RepID=UPI0030785192
MGAEVVPLPRAEAPATGPVTELAQFLDLVAAPGRPPIDAGQVMVVVAHPDDETLGAGALLPRLRGVRLVHVTDGAPLSMTDATAAGFSTREDYAAARLAELRAAMDLAGVPGDALHALGVIDQGVGDDLPGIARRLADLMAAFDTAIVLTHAYEGGHPDHDGVSYAVRAASDLLAAAGRRAPGIAEMPLYHADGAGLARQRFPAALDYDAPETGVLLDETARSLKRRMMECFRTQAYILDAFTSEVERFRLAQGLDHRLLPNSGDLWYERFAWGMTGPRWLALVAAADRALGLERP